MSAHRRALTQLAATAMILAPLAILQPSLAHAAPSAPQPAVSQSILTQFAQMLRSFQTYLSTQQQSGIAVRSGGYAGVPEQVAALGNGSGYGRIDNLSNTVIQNPTITGGSISGASITGTISNIINTALATIADLTSTNLVATNATTTNLAVANLTATATSTLSGLKLAATDCSAYGNGGKLTTDAFGIVVCAADQGGAGGTVGGLDTQVQFNDAGVFGGSAGFTYNKTAQRVIVAYASTTAITASYASSTQGFFGALSAGTLSLAAPLSAASGGTGSTTLSGILKGNGTSGVQTALPGTDYELPLSFNAPLSRLGNSISLSTAGDWSGTLGGFSAAQLIAAGFSTTSADTWKANHSFFATSSTDFWLTQKTTDNLAQGASNKYYATSLVAADLAATTTSALAEGSNLYYTANRVAGVIAGTTTSALAEGSNLYFTNARADARINATSTIGTLTSAPNLATVATSLTGFLKATAGVLSTAAINLASDVIGILPVTKGGTGWAALASGSIPYGNGSGAVATTSAGTAGQVLALLNGVPTWTATTTFSAPLSYAGGAVSIAQANGSTNGYLASADWTLFNSKIASSSLSAAYPLAYNSGSGVFTTAFSTTTGNSFNQLQQFNANASTSALTVTGNTYFPGSSIWRSDGNVGIGTTTPGSLLSLNNIANFTTATSTFYSTGGINLAAGCFARAGSCLSFADLAGTLGVAQGGTGTTTQVTNGVTYFNGTKITSSDNFVFNGSGNVGIGTSTPGGKLHVNGGAGLFTPNSSAFALRLAYNNSQVTSDSWFMGVTDNGGSSNTSKFQLANAATSPLLTMTFGGNLGLGTTTPGSLLSLNNIANFTAATSTFYSDVAFSNVPSVPQPAFNNYLSQTPWNDTSSVLRSPAKFYETSYYTNPATGRVSRFNRVLVGLSALANGDTPQTSPQWTETYFANWNSNAQLGVTASIGLQAVLGASRTSDFRAWTGSPSGGSQGVTGLGVNDDAGAIACGVCGIAVQATSSGIALNQFDAGALAPTLVPTPSGGVTGLMAFAVGLTPGAYASTSVYDVSAGLYVGGSSFGTTFHKGIIVFDDALNKSIGSSGAGIALEMARGQEVRWLSPTNSVDASLYSTTSGLRLDGGLDIRSAVNGIQLIIGDATTTTTNKVGRVGAAHYSNSEEPSATLVTVNTSSATSISLGGGSGVMNAATSLLFYTAANNTTLTGTERLRIDSSGNLGLGTSTPSAQLHTTGTVRFSNFGAGTLTTDASGNLSVSSDERLKTIDGAFSRGLADIVKLSPINYHWNGISGLDTSTQYAGFSAQNVQQAIPEAVGSSANGFLSLQDRPLIAAVVNAIKELSAKLDTLATQVSGFAEHFTTGELFARRGRFSELCVEKSSGTAVCVTGDQLAAALAASDSNGSYTITTSNQSAPPLEQSATSTATSAPAADVETDAQATSTSLTDNHATSTPSTDFNTQPPVLIEDSNPFNAPPANDNASSTTAVDTAA